MVSAEGRILARMTLLVFTLGVLYAGVATTLHMPRPVGHSLSILWGKVASITGQRVNQSTSPDAAPVTSYADLSLQRLGENLKRVSGLTNLTAVPSSSGEADVSALVQLQTPQSGSAPVTTRSIAKDAQEFFATVFSSAPAVGSAEVYFESNGRLVAGAALGRDAYDRLALGAVTRSHQWLLTLARQPQDTVQGPNECWFATSRVG